MSKPIPPSSLVRLFVPDDLSANAEVGLDPGQSHYLVNVMRRRPGDALALFNGRDGEWRCRLTEAAKRQCRVRVEEQLRPQEDEPDLWLCFAPVKKTGTHFIVEKATELGVSALVPVITANTESARVNVDRFRTNATEAAEQCERLSVPEVRAAIKLPALLRGWPTDRRLMFCDEDAPLASAHDVLSRTFDDHGVGPWAVLTGPEGGFNEAERQALRGHPSAVPVSLGRRTLRAETAVVVALALWQSAATETLR